MKRTISAVILVAFLFGFTGYASPSYVDTIKEKPDVFCRVLKEPDPMLLGSWKCTFERPLEEGGWETNPAEYRLIKHDGKYALYFYRISRGGKKKYMGWRDWTIDGTQITSDTGVKIFTQDGQVFFVWQNGKPTKMTRIGAQ